MSNGPIEAVRDHKPAPLAPVDPAVRIPQHVRDAAARADAYYAQQLDQNAGAGGGADPNAPKPGEVITPQPDPAPQPTSLQPDPAPAPQPTLDDMDPANDGATLPEQWAHKFKSMRGRYKGAQQQISMLQDQVTQLGEIVQQLRQPPQREAVTNPLPTHAETTRLLNEKDEENYGVEILDTMKRAAKEAIAPELDALRQENQHLKQTAEQLAESEFFRDVTTAVPNWRVINRHPAFVRWLGLPDLYSGRLRSDLLQEHRKALRAPQCVAFFKGFLAEAKPGPGQDAIPQPEPLIPAARQAAVSLESLAAPGRARPASGAESPNVPVEKPVFTRAQVSKFFTDTRLMALGQGPWAGREAEKAAMERDIFAAQREGRVR